ncbi:MAG: tRNA (adenosine(37)-N6)-dimethylallyltransferase MiaA [Candidatus Neomarinimicrobiota bacterium]
MQEKIPILVIAGPTGVGKTAVTIALAQRIDGEIIGLDSRQIYAGMAIGTAQPTMADQAAVPHHLIGFRSPDQKITAGEYAELVRAVIEDIRWRRRQPLICGGAGLYYRAINQGIFSASNSDPVVRERLEAEYAADPDSLFKRLREVDAEYALKVHVNNRKRLVRALEIYEFTGLSPSEHFRRQPEKKYPYDLFTVLLTRTSEELESRIRLRTGLMLNNGWIKETRTLLRYREKGHFHALDSIGYREIMAHLEGKLSYDEMVSLIVLRTRQYAKRQLTWFRKENPDLTINLTNSLSSVSVTEEILEQWLLFRSG